MDSKSSALIFDQGCNGWLQLTSGISPTLYCHIRFDFCYSRRRWVVQVASTEIFNKIAKDHRVTHPPIPDSCISSSGGLRLCELLQNHFLSPRGKPFQETETAQAPGTNSGMVRLLAPLGAI
jgi:hypothetical protein